MEKFHFLPLKFEIALQDKTFQANCIHMLQTWEQVWGVKGIRVLNLHRGEPRNLLFLFENMVELRAWSNFVSIIDSRAFWTVRVITISGYLMTSPTWMSEWDLEETHSLLYSSLSDFVPYPYPMKPSKIQKTSNYTQQAKNWWWSQWREGIIQMKSRVEVHVAKGSIEE